MKNEGTGFKKWKMKAQVENVCKLNIWLKEIVFRIQNLVIIKETSQQKVDKRTDTSPKIHR